MTEKFTMTTEIQTWQERSGMREFILPAKAAPHMIAEIADLRKALAASQEELEEWRFTNKVDELQRENDRLRLLAKQAEAAPVGAQDIKDMAQARRIITQLRAALAQCAGSGEENLAGYFYKDHDTDGWRQAFDPVGFPGMTKLYTAPPSQPDSERDAARYRWLRDSTANSLYIDRNGENAPNYATAKQWIEDHDTEDEFRNCDPKSIQAMKDSNTIWCVQIYPDTPNGSRSYYAETLDAVVDLAMKEEPK